MTEIQFKFLDNGRLEIKTPEKTVTVPKGCFHVSEPICNESGWQYKISFDRPYDLLPFQYLLPTK